MTSVNCIGKRLKTMADVKLSVMSILNAPFSLKCVVSISNAPRRLSLLMVDNNAICRSLLKKRRFGLQYGVVMPNFAALRAVFPLSTKHLRGGRIFAPSVGAPVNLGLRSNFQHEPFRSNYSYFDASSQEKHDAGKMNVVPLLSQKL